MDLEELEDEFGFQFPLPHRADIQNLSSPIHKACEFLIPDGPGLLDFAKVNRFLRKESWQGWTAQYVAFASNGCGDYYAYDTSTRPYRVVYVDPIEYVAEAENSGRHYGEWRVAQLELAAELDDDFI